MNLADYLAGDRGRCAAVARSVGVAAAWLSQMASRARPVPPHIAPRIEVATGGAVRRWDLRPADWCQIWPELVGADGAPEVGDQQAA